MLQPSPRVPSAPLLVCHSHLRWDWVYQRPQHLLSRLARDWPVVVEEEALFDDRPPGLDILSVAEGVTVVRPHRPAGRSFDLEALVDGYVAAVRGDRQLVRWFYSPMFAPHGDRLGLDQVVVYDCMDELANFAGAPAGLIEAEGRLLARADLVFTGGRSLYESKRDRNANVHCFPSAVDAAHFGRALEADLAVPADLAALPGPIFGYYGVIDERLDYDLIARLSESPGVGSVVLVGPTIKVDPAALPRRSNLHYLGQRSYEELPAYLKGFDVCIMPWALNEATRTISPTKTLEYMAAGKPIVSTAVRDVVGDHGDLVFVAEDAAAFATIAVEALSRFDPVRGAAERRRAADRGWDATAHAMSDRIAQRLHAPSEDTAPRPKSRTTRGSDARNLIVGGGPAGLSAALHLDDPDFILAEKHSRTGGLCRSIIEEGFTFDYAGHIFFTNDKYVDGLFRDVLKDNFHEQLRESWVYLYGDYQRYPFQANLFGLPPAVVKECLLGVIEASRTTAPLRLNGNGDGAAKPPANFLEWSYRTFGAGITNHFMKPYNRKVWGIDPEKMSSDWIEGRVLTPTLDEVIEGALHRGRPDMGPNARFGYPTRGGCEAFVAGLAGRVGARGGSITPNRTLVKVDPKRRRATFRIEDGEATARYETIGYETLYPSVPLPDLIAAIDAAPEAVRRAAGSLPSTAVVCVNLGINREKVTEKHWIYYPEGQEKYIFQRIFVQSNASPFNAPPGHSALTFEISHSPSKPLPVRGKRALVDACVSGLKQTDLWREGDEVVFEQVLGMPHAYIPFTPERTGHLAIINDYLHSEGIYPIGRFGEWKYLNQDGAILSSKRVVESVRGGGRLEPPRKPEAAASPRASSNGTARPVVSS
jgi:UDP-galactopyranose mutase